ncbi:MAG TPA: DegT/DnrJ/EryC1/StrS family aminotransferase [Dongiaceae bacterium]|jgi:dTDP-4-amino-4,6-dideoxygalactose transaminase|nr:DegT/DnrJ/EryC1/StrS family aminotransferase [Dongiaceae bacterium]
MTKTPMLPIALPKLGEPEIAAVARVIGSGWITQGPEVAAFEAEFAGYCGAREAVAVSNCTTALHLCLYALGVGAGDEVIVPSLSFIASANAIAHTGATPIFADVALDDLNIDPTAIEAAITPRTKAIMAVHQLGMPARIAEIAALAERTGLALVEDAACAIGSRVKTGDTWRNVGAPLGTAACFSFHPRKLLTTGDGGMITTDDPDFAARLRRLRQHGMSVTDRERHAAGRVIFESYDEIGFNYRLTDIQAAIGREQLKRIPAMVAERRRLVDLYRVRLAAIPGVICPADRADTETNWQSFHVFLPAAADQHAVMESMLAAGVATRRCVMCAHLEPAYEASRARNVGNRSLANSEYAAAHGIVLPLFSGMSEADVATVCDALRGTLAATARKAS